VLCSICDDVIMPENYHRHMIGSVVDQTILEELLSSHLPQLNTHLHRLNVPTSIITQAWFFCFFIGYVPWEMGLHILDAIFYFGPKFMFSVGMAIFKYHAAKILSLDQCDLAIQLFKQRFQFSDLLLNDAFDYMHSITEEKIQEIRNQCKFKTIQEMEFTTKFSTIRKLQVKTNFSEAELESIYDRFHIVIDQLPEEDITEESFKSVFNTFIPLWRYRLDLITPLYKMSSRDDGVFNLIEFVRILNVLRKGNIKDRFTICAQLQLFPNDLGLIDKGDFYNIIDALVRLYGGDVVQKDLGTFVAMTYEKVDPDKNGKANLESIVQEIIDRPILEIFVSDPVDTLNENSIVRN